MKCPQIWRTTHMLVLAMAAIMLSPLATAETVKVTLSQEQDGGEMGRACIYVHQGKAEYRIVKSHEQCAPHITVSYKKA